MQRLLKAGDAPARALRLNALTPVELQDSDQCCGFGGTYSMTEWPVSTALADAKWAAIQKACQAGAKALTSADLGCLLHLAGRQSRVGGSLPVVYVAELIDWADAHSLDEKLGPQSAKEES
jgi:L-lactate dehydrogenase complex protein LldE